MENKIVIIMFEPALEGENLTVTQQVHEVVGPFEDYDVAMKWLERWERRRVVSAALALAPAAFVYLLHPVTSPEELLG